MSFQFDFIINRGRILLIMLLCSFFWSISSINALTLCRYSRHSTLVFTSTIPAIGAYCTSRVSTAATQPAANAGKPRS